MAQPGQGLNLTERVKERLEERRLVGLRKYGKELTPDTGVDFLDEAIDEALDLVMYLMALKLKWESLPTITNIPPDTTPSNA